MYTVIVADDEEEIRRGIIKKVKWEELGFQVIGEAANGADALELVEKLEPDLLLTDIRMPFLSGIDLDTEYDHCLTEMGFSRADLIQMLLNSARAAFLPEAEKQALIEKIHAASSNFCQI